MKTLLILRHAQALYTSGNDFQRPLSETGLKDAQRMGMMLKKLNCVPDLIISSPAQRTQQTTELIGKHSGISGEIIYSQGFYSGDENTIIDTIKLYDDSIDTILIVGHNPTLEDFVSLVTTKGVLRITLKPASCVCLVCNSLQWSDIENSQATIRWLITPDMIR